MVQTKKKTFRRLATGNIFRRNDNGANILRQICCEAKLAEISQSELNGVSVSRQFGSFERHPKINLFSGFVNQAGRHVNSNAIQFYVLILP